MKVIRNREDLENLRNEIPQDSYYSSLESDIKMIEEYFEQPSDEFGPLIILISNGEQEEMEDKYPVIKALEPEAFVSVYEDEKIKIERTCYILTDAGYIVYITSKKD